MTNAASPVARAIAAELERINTEAAELVRRALDAQLEVHQIAASYARLEAEHTELYPEGADHVRYASHEASQLNPLYDILAVIGIDASIGGDAGQAEIDRVERLRAEIADVIDLTEAKPVTTCGCADRFPHPPNAEQHDRILTVERRGAQGLADLIDELDVERALEHRSGEITAADFREFVGLHNWVDPVGMAKFADYVDFFHRRMETLEQLQA